MVPVMIWGMLVSRKVYGRNDWTVALAVTLGVSCFLYGGSFASPVAKLEKPSSFYGLCLLALFLVADVQMMWFVTFNAFGSCHRHQDLKSKPYVVHLRAKFLGGG